MKGHHMIAKKLGHTLIKQNIETEPKSKVANVKNRTIETEPM